MTLRELRDRLDALQRDHGLGDDVEVLAATEVLVTVGPPDRERDVWQVRLSTVDAAVLAYHRPAYPATRASQGLRSTRTVELSLAADRHGSWVPEEDYRA